MHRSKHIGSLHLHTCKDPHEAALAAGRKIEEIFDRTKKRGESVLFLASGGSALDILKHISGETLGNHVTITVLDERYDPTHKHSNFASLTQIPFYEAAELAGCQFVDTRVREGESQEALATRFETSLRVWKQEHPEGVIIATIGIGADGHTAGIMPMPNTPGEFDMLFNGDAWVASYYAASAAKHPRRITTTFMFLSLVDYSFVYAMGREKHHVLIGMLGMMPVPEMPAHFLKRLAGDLYTDQKLL